MVDGISNARGEVRHRQLGMYVCEINRMLLPPYFKASGTDFFVEHSISLLRSVGDPETDTSLVVRCIEFLVIEVAYDSYHQFWRLLVS
jgi:hypothetical protein